MGVAWSAVLRVKVEVLGDADLARVGGLGFGMAVEEVQSAGWCLSGTGDAERARRVLRPRSMDGWM